VQPKSAGGQPHKWGYQKQNAGRSDLEPDGTNREPGHSAQAFQDIPFSLSFTFQALDQRFPGSKFILTVRDSPEQWYTSLTRFHAALFGKNGQIPTLDDLKAAKKVYPGWAYEAKQLLYETPLDDPYNKEILISSYIAHNEAVREYFRHRPGDLLTLNVAEPGAYDKLCDFLGKPRSGKVFPWENKTSDRIEECNRVE